MFDNIGGKIKTLAKVVCWIGIVLCVIIGVIMIVVGANVGGANGTSAIVGGIVVAVAGALASWIGSFLVYGFGELVDKTRSLAEK